MRGSKDEDLTSNPFPTRKEEFEALFCSPFLFREGDQGLEFLCELSNCRGAKATRNCNTIAIASGTLLTLAFLFPLAQVHHVERQSSGVSGFRRGCDGGRARLSAAEGQLRVGFIGVGNRGTTLLRNFLEAKLGDVVAVCDIKLEHAKRAAKLITDAGQKEPTLFEDWKKLLEAKDVQVVVAALPCDLHAECYLDVIAAGKDLYGEKPMCLTPADCEKVVKAANGSKQIVQIGFQRAPTRGFIEPMKLIHEGELGELVEGRIMWSNSWGPLGDWFGKRARSGDWMVEQACHNWDVMNWACRGLPVRADGSGSHRTLQDVPARPRRSRLLFGHRRIRERRGRQHSAFVGGTGAGRQVHEGVQRRIHAAQRRESRHRLQQRRDCLPQGVEHTGQGGTQREGTSTTRDWAWRRS